MARTLSFAAVHMGVAFSVGYLMTGSVAVGGALALVEPMVNTVAYFFHEKIWLHIERRAGDAGDLARIMPPPKAAPTH